MGVSLNTSISSSNGNNKWSYKNLLGGLGGTASVIQNSFAMSELPEPEEEQQAIDNLYSNTSTSDSMSDLQNLFDSTQLAKTNYRWKDVMKMSNTQAAGNVIGTGAAGADAGFKVGGGWGALGGGILGLLSSGFGYLARVNKAKKTARRLNREGARANAVFVDNFSNSVDNAMVNKRNQSLLNLAAFGGPLDTTFTNGVRFIEEGGSHEQNPLGGILQGIASDGIPNLVEEGEAIYNDYVYSKRLKVPQADKESLGLKKDKEYTYADAAKQIQKESEERPNDPISKRNLAEMMSRLQGSQEALKEKRDGQAFKRAVNKMTPDELAMFMQQLQQPQQMQPMMAMQGMQPMQPTQSEVPMFAKGGLLGHKHDNGDSLWLAQPQEYNNGYIPANLNELGLNILYNNVYNGRIDNSTGRGITEQFLQGLPIVVGADENRTASALVEPIKSNVTGFDVPTVKASDILSSDKTKEVFDRAKKAPSITPNDEEEVSEFDTPSNSWAQALRAAPVFGSLATTIASLFDKPNYSNIRRAERAMAGVPRVSAPPIGQRMTYNPIDINYIATQQANNALGARRALAEYGAGNPAGIQQAIIANNYANQTALGQAIMQANQLNRQNLAQALEFNRQTDSANAANNMQAALANQQRDLTAAGFLMRTGQLRDAELGRVQANRSANLTGLFNNLGNLGQDILNRKQAAAVAASLGVTYNDLMKALALTSTGESIRAKGGKLNTKKGGKDA